MNVTTHSELTPDEPESIEDRLQRIEGELEHHLPEDQRLQSSIPGGREASGFAYPPAREAAPEVPRGPGDRRPGFDPSEPSFAEFYEPGIADVDPDEELGRGRRPVAPANPQKTRASRSADNLRRILVDLGAAPEAPPAPAPKPVMPPAVAEPMDRDLDGGLLELQPDDMPEAPGRAYGMPPGPRPTEAEFLRQSGLTDAARGGGRDAAPRAVPAPKRPAPPVAEGPGELRDRLGDLPAPPRGDLDKALAMARTLEKTGPRPASPPDAEPPADLASVQAYLEALHEQIEKPGPPADAQAAPAAKPSVVPVVAATAAGTTLLLAVLYLLYLAVTGQISLP